jgi:hypothetical protein
MRSAPAEGVNVMWLLFGLEVMWVLAQPAQLGGGPVAIPLVSLDDKQVSRRLFEAACSPEKNVVLILKGVKTQAPPGASWQVHVEPTGANPNEPGRDPVGIISVYDPVPGRFVFVIDPVINAVGEKDLQVRFVPTTGLVVEGKPQLAEFRSDLTIGEIALAIEGAPR